MKVRFCLRESGSQAVGRAAEKLGSLRGERNKADYDLKLRLFDPAGVAIQLRMTQEIVDAIDRCRNDPALAEIREKTRSYARDVLRFLSVMIEDGASEDAYATSYRGPGGG